MIRNLRRRRKRLVRRADRIRAVAPDRRAEIPPCGHHEPREQHAERIANAQWLTALSALSATGASIRRLRRGIQMTCYRQ
jgi:hypothetical protein